MNIFARFFCMYVFLITPALLVSAEKTEYKKSTITKSRIDRVNPSYESFIKIKRVLEILEEKAICKHQVGKEYLFKPELYPIMGQTQQGIRLYIERNFPLRLQTEFGTVSLKTNSHIRFSNIVEKLWSADTPIVFDASFVGTGDCRFYNIKAIGAEYVPQAQVAVKYLPKMYLYQLWQTYSKRYETEKAQNSNIEQSHAVSGSLKQDNLKIPDTKSHDSMEQKKSKANTDSDQIEGGWVVV